MWTIYLKEIGELMRDRKTLIFTVIIPILVMPLLSFGFGYISYVMSRNAYQAKLSYAVFGQENAPALAARFAADKTFKLVEIASQSQINSAINSDKIRFALVIVPAPAAAGAGGIRVQLHYNTATAVDVVAKRVRTVIDAENGALRRNALPAMHLSDQQLAFLLNPIALEKHSSADQREQMGEIVGRVLPYILVIVCLIAAMYPAIDIGAGEKERGTLESLLLAPVSRGALVLAKFGVIFTAGLTSALLMVISIALLVTFFGNAIDPGLAQMMRSIGGADLAMLALMLLPTAAIFAALLLSISLYAKSFKEAQGYIQPLMLVVLLPVMLAVLPGVTLNWGWALVPLTNVSLAMRELVKGTMDYRMFLLIFLSTTVIAGILLRFCRWWCSREQVLLRN